jgi:preprotein translocase subunit YajC
MTQFLTFAAAPPDGLAAFLQSPLPMVLMMLAAMYFLVIRPQSKKQKEHANMLAKLQKNDEVLTAGGLIGTVVSVGEKTLTIRVADNVRLEIEKSYVVQKR